ncbi:MAG: DUF92 domain-containing protein [Candidatus Odinarchaeota archaeon]
MDSISAYLVLMIPLAVLLNIPVLVIVIRKQYLTNPGLIVAVALGVTLFVIQPFFWVVLLTFFFTSSILSKVKVTEKSSVAVDFEKGSTKRDAFQVVANSLIPLFFAFGYAMVDLLPFILDPSTNIQTTLSPFFVSVFVAFSVHNADTWATELGLLSKRTPRLVTSLNQKVPPGTSGGITIDGWIASLLGGLVIAIVYTVSVVFLSPVLIFDAQTLIIILLIILGGFAGSTMDSIEGATIQGIYYCNHCAKETESNPHPRCGNETVYHRGFKLINNDFVNLSSALVVTLTIFLVVILI